jgi:hypothetical protein
MDGERWRSLSVNERRVLDAITCQHFRYYQRDNGDLKVSYSDFAHAGISNRRQASAAIKRLREIGMIDTKRGAHKYKTYGASRNFVWVPLEVMESESWCGLSIKPGFFLLQAQPYSPGRTGTCDRNLGQWTPAR